MGIQVRLDWSTQTLDHLLRFRCCCEDCSLVGVESRTNDSMRSRVVRSRLEWTLTSELSRERRLVREQVS